MVELVWGSIPNHVRERIITEGYVNDPCHVFKDEFREWCREYAPSLRLLMRSIEVEYNFDPLTLMGDQLNIERPSVGYLSMTDEEYFLFKLTW